MGCLNASTPKGATTASVLMDIQQHRLVHCWSASMSTNAEEQILADSMPSASTCRAPTSAYVRRDSRDKAINLAKVCLFSITIVLIQRDL